eukprot:7802631-Karenia_brevis.AAC.1
MGGTEKEIDSYHEAVERDDYIATLRPIVHPELTIAPAETQAAADVCVQFVSLRGALAYATITQAWIQ